MALAARVRAEFGLGWLPRCSVFVPPAADVLWWRTGVQMQRHPHGSFIRSGSGGVWGSDWIWLRDPPYS